MARRKQHWLVTLLLGKPKKSRRSSSGRRKSGSNPANVARKYQRWATTVNSNRAASVKERNDLREKNAKARVQLDQEIARKKRAKAAQKKVREDARAARVKAAAARSSATRAGTAAPATVRPPVKAIQRKSTSAELAHAAKCGARCDDGTPCENPSLGETCAAGHNPKAPKAKTSYRANWNRTTQQPGETSDDFLRRERFERAGGQFLRDQAKVKTTTTTRQPGESREQFLRRGRAEAMGASARSGKRA